MNKRANGMIRRRRARGGFTLIEVLLVVAILGILAGVVVVNFAGKGEAARLKAARASIAAVCTAVDMFEVDMGQYPNDMNDLVSNPGRGENWHGPYLRGGVPVDPWGRKFNYRAKTDSAGYLVWSCGVNGTDESGQGDDVTSFQM